MLEVDVRHRLGDFNLNVQFKAERGVTALFGQSGAGKTCTINAIAGLLRPRSGRVVVDGRVLFDSETRIQEPAWRRRIGYVFQDGRLFPHLTVRQNLQYGAWATRRSMKPADFHGIVDLLGLGPLLGRRPGDLSGGEAQRVAIGRALLCRPSTLLMDEPLASLDADRRAEILPYIEQLYDATGLPVVYVSHDLEEVMRLATTMILLADGQVSTAGPIADVIGGMEIYGAADSFDAGAVIFADVIAQDDMDGLTRLRCRAGELVVPRVEVGTGRRVRVYIRARDVMLATEEPRGLSALNVFKGMVAAVRRGESAEALVRIDCAGEMLLAKITRRSLVRLGLAPGSEVYVVIKSVALRHAAAQEFSAIYREAGS